MKISPRVIAYITMLVLWGPSNGLYYLWGFILFAFLIITKPRWFNLTGFFTARIILCIQLFFIAFIISSIANYFLKDSSINNILWSIITYGSSLLLLVVFLKMPFQEIDLYKLLWFLLYLSVFEVFVGYYQMLEYHSFSSINPFNRQGGASAGDSFVGTTFDLGIGNMAAIKVSAALLLFLPFWFAKKNLKNSLIVVFLLFGWLMASAIYTLILGLAVVFYYYFFRKILIAFFTFKLSRSIFYAAVFGVVSVFIFIATQPDNIVYITETFKGVYRAFAFKEIGHSGRKMVYYRQTLIDLPAEYPSMAVIGVGPGNYSSRSAWLVSGQYLLNQPEYIPVTPSEIAEKYTISLWNKNMISEAFKGGGSMTNQPFSSWFSVLGEFGLPALACFVLIFVFLFRAFENSVLAGSEFIKMYAFGLKLSLIYILLLFFVDNLFEWPLVMGQFFVFACAFIRVVENANQRGLDKTLLKSVR